MEAFENSVEILDNRHRVCTGFKKLKSVYSEDKIKPSIFWMEAPAGIGTIER